MRALALRRIVVITADLERIAAFHARAAGFVDVGPEVPVGAAWATLLGVGAARQRVMRLGDQEVAFVAPERPVRPYPAGSTATDLWFQHMALVVDDIDAAHALVMTAGASPISTAGPEQLPPGAGAVRAFKFRDPDGHPLELLWFPPGTGDARWTRARGRALFAGIDHSAIAVRDAGASARFYARSLGLRRGDATVNHGAAQTHLDAVPGDVVEVLPLFPAAATPHVELLAYRTGTRRPRPVETGVADTRLVFTVAPTDTRSEGGTALRDPDGHGLVAMTEAFTTGYL